MTAFKTACDLTTTNYGFCVSLSGGTTVTVLGHTPEIPLKHGHQPFFRADFIADVLRTPEPSLIENLDLLFDAAPVMAAIANVSWCAVRVISSGPTDGIVWLLALPRPTQPSELKRLESQRLALGWLAELSQSKLMAQDPLAEVERERVETYTAPGFDQCHWIVSGGSRECSEISQNFFNLFHLQPSVLKNDSNGFMSSVMPEDKDHVLAHIHNFFDQGIDCEFRVIGPQNELKWIWLRSFPLDRSERNQRFLFVAENISARKEREQHERSHQAQLAADAKMVALGELAGGVAHEINNPLTVITAKASELRRRLGKGDLSNVAVQEIAMKIENMSMRVADIIKSLKGLARRDNNLMRHKVEFEHIFRDIRNLVNERFSDDIELRLPSWPKGFGAEMHATQISQLFVILLNNAIDAVHGEGVLNFTESDKKRERWIEIDYAEDEDSVFIYVTDSGPGIPIKIRSRIFDPFFTTKSAGRGTGLGLSLAQGIVARHGGSIKLDTLHPNTRFVVQLPKVQAAPLTTKVA